MSVTEKDRFEEEFERLDEEAKSAMNIGRDGFLRAGIRFAKMADHGYFQGGGHETMKDYYESISVDPSFGKKLENAGRWLIECKVKNERLKNLTLSAVQVIAGMKNPEVWIDRAEKNTLQELKEMKIEALHGVKVQAALPSGGRCAHCKDGDCEFGYNTKDAEDKAKAYRPTDDEKKPEGKDDLI